jgi:16S rRNA processing protein RimM
MVKELFVVALLGAPFGVKGQIKVHSLSGETVHLARVGEARLRQDGKEKIYRIEAVELLGKDLLMKFAGIDSPEEAKTLTGAEIIVPREKAAPLKDGEYYVEDLKGLRILYGGEELGQICDIIEGGGGNLAEIELLSGKKCLVPFRNEFFGETDPQKGFAILLNTWILG